MNQTTSNESIASNVQKQQQPVQVTDPEVTATSTAVSNMIIKAAADFISIQENVQNHNRHQNHRNHEIATESILMSLNTAVNPINDGAQSQIIVTSGGSLNEVAVVGTPTQMCNRPQQYLARHHSLIDTRPTKEVAAAAVAAAAATDPLVNLLLNHAEVQVQKAQAAAAAASAAVNGVQSPYSISM